MADESPPPSPTSATPPPHTTGGGFRWEPPTAEQLQAAMPGYTIEKLLGRGGMGAVYRGVQTNLDRPVAIKILPPGVEKEDPSFAERFKSEARLMAKLMHPGVVAVFDFGTTAAGQLYFAMEYVDGSDVSQMIAAQGRLEPEHALAIIAHMCDALGAAHELGIVHRDIKPANVLINTKGQVKIADFGLAKIEEPGGHGLTKTGYAMGTPDFVSPEALTLGTAIDGRADIYALGVMLYQMLTGNIPRGAFKPAAVLRSTLDPRFDPIINKAMQHDRAERYQSAAELRRDLDVILTVPLVRNDAPTQAAIPVAQMAQPPGQRSAAQKPVAKGPPPRERGTPLPQHQSPAPSGVGAPRSQPKSKTPLFIGLGAAAAIGIGAFVMFSGGEKAKSKGPPAPSSGAKVTQNSGQPPKTAPGTVAPPSKPATPPQASTSTSTTASKPSEPQFPPGKWVKVFTRAEDLPENLRKPDSGVKFENGWIRLTPGQPQRIPIVSGITNCGIRARVERATERPKNSSTFILRADGTNSTQYYRLYYNFTNRYLVAHKRVQDDSSYLFQAPLNVPSNGVGQYTMEFAATGTRLIGRFGSDTVRMARGADLTGGVAYITGDESLRDIEVINLDGLSEAEALKILGVDEKGNDLRKAAVATVSSPSPPVSKSSETQFPPGQWVKVFTKVEDLPDGLRKRQPSTGGDGWIIAENSGERLHLPDGLQGNYAVRAILRMGSTGQSNDSFFALRVSEGGGYQSFASKTLKLSIQKRVKSEYVTFPTPPLISNRALAPGETVPIEFGAVGPRLVARGGAAALHTVLDSTFSKGSGHITIKDDIRDIEVINLDGLPEAEALRILGVDEKGNDLRALTAKQEERQKSQAAQADAMAAIPELKTLHEQFVKLQAERVTAPFEADVAKLNSGYLGGLDRKIGEMKQKGDLDAVLALEEEKKLVTGARTPSSAVVPMTANADGGVRAPDDTPDLHALKDLRQIYRDAYAKLDASRAANLKLLTDPLDARLRQIEATLTQQDRIDHAKTVREYREGLSRDAGTPARNASTGGTAATMNEADKSVRAPLKKFPPGDDRKAAEWALSLGGIVYIEGSDPQAINSLEALPNKSFKLRSINLKGRSGQAAPNVTDLTPIAGLQELRSILLTGAQISDADTDLLASCPLLQHMDLAYTTKFTGVEAAKLAQSGNFQELTAGGSALNGEGIRQLSEISSLVRLNFGRCKITDADIAPLNRLKKLISLRLHQTDVTLEGWRQIKELPLTEIGFHSEAGRMASDCRELAGLFPRTQLVEFLSNSPITAEDVAALGDFKNLNRLVLTSSHINDVVLEALSGLKGITELQMKSQDAPITLATDEGLAQLLKLNSLNHLQIERFDNLSPSIFTTLTKHKALRKLTIRSCPKVTDAAVAAFKKARPDVTIVR